jgi:uncharacterized protein (UPF0548 family)
MQAALMDCYDAAEILFGTRSHRDYKRVLKLIESNKLRSVGYGVRKFVVRTSLEELI